MRSSGAPSSPTLPGRPETTPPACLKSTSDRPIWLEALKDHIVGSVGIDLDAFQYAPFNQQGGLARAYTVFGTDLQPLLEELNLESVG